MNINTVVMSGRLVKEPELKNISETNLCSFRIASNRTVGKKRVEKSIFIDVDVWGGAAKPCSDYLKKGSRVAVEGVLCQDTWEAEGGKKNSKIFIEASNVMFVDAPEKNGTSDTSAPAPDKEAPKKTPAAAPKGEDDDSELPF